MAGSSPVRWPVALGLLAAAVSQPVAGQARPAPAGPEDGGPRNWVVAVETALNLRSEPSLAGEVLARHAPGTLLDNLGCRAAAGRTWCDVQELGGGPRGWVAAAYLHPAVSPDGSVQRGPDDSASRAGNGDFDARAPVPCASASDRPMGSCEMAVARAGGGYATVVITRSSGAERMIYFRMGIPVGYGYSQAEGQPGEFFFVRSGDRTTVRIGDERYEIADAVVLGG